MRVLLETFLLPRLAKKFPATYGTCKFIAFFTTAQHLSVTCARWVQFTPSYPVSLISIFKSAYNLFLGLPSSTSFRFPPKIPYKFCYMSHPFLTSWFGCPNNTWWADKIWSSSLRSFFQSTVTSFLLDTDTFLSLYISLKVYFVVPVTYFVAHLKDFTV